MNHKEIQDFILSDPSNTGIAICATIILSCHFYIFKLYKQVLKDRQKEIDRLAEENHQYRDRFIKLLDNKFNYKTENDI